MTIKIHKNYIAGEFISSDHLFDNINPIDGSLISRMAEVFPIPPIATSPLLNFVFQLCLHMQILV